MRGWRGGRILIESALRGGCRSLHLKLRLCCWVHEWRSVRREGRYSRWLVGSISNILFFLLFLSKLQIFGRISSRTRSFYLLIFDGLLTLVFLRFLRLFLFLFQLFNCLIIALICNHFTWLSKFAFLLSLYFEDGHCFLIIGYVLGSGAGWRFYLSPHLRNAAISWNWRGFSFLVGTRYSVFSLSDIDEGDYFPILLLHLF